MSITVNHISSVSTLRWKYILQESRCYRKVIWPLPFQLKCILLQFLYNSDNEDNLKKPTLLSHGKKNTLSIDEQIFINRFVNLHIYIYIYYNMLFVAKIHLDQLIFQTKSHRNDFLFLSKSWRDRDISCNLWCRIFMRYSYM